MRTLINSWFLASLIVALVAALRLFMTGLINPLVSLPMWAQIPIAALWLSVAAYAIFVRVWIHHPEIWKRLTKFAAYNIAFLSAAGVYAFLIQPAAQGDSLDAHSTDPATALVNNLTELGTHVSLLGAGVFSIIMPIFCLVIIFQRNQNISQAGKAASLR